MRYEQDNTSDGSTLNSHAAVRSTAQTGSRSGLEREQTPVPAAPSGAFDIFTLIRRSLRGRYALAIGLTLVGVTAGVLVGWYAEAPDYKSEGLVRIAYSMTPVLKQTDQNQPMPMFESYMRSQQLRMTSQSLAQKALTAMHPDTTITSAMMSQFAEHLVVEHPNNGDQLRPSYTDTDPFTAASAVSAVISAFRDEYDKSDKAEQEQRIAALDVQRQDLQKMLVQMQRQEGSASSINHQLIVDQIDAAEQLKRQSIRKEMEQSDRLEQLHEAGLMDDHPSILEAKATVQRAHAMVEREDAEVLRLRGMLADDGGALLPPRRNVTAQDLRGPDPRNAPVDGAGDEGTVYRKQLAEIIERIQALKLEMGESRLDIISMGDIPLQPYRDRRRYLAYAGAMVGGCLPTALLVLLGLIRPRYRYSDETQVDVAGPGGLLGILPILPNHLSDPDRAAGAAQCVHQMRMMLQVAAAGEPRQYLMTSACAGEGKTSLSLAMGLSFAASGTRTLVIDADLVGRALTRGFGATNERGLYEALETGESSPFVRQTTSGLWFLPAGRANALHASKTSSHAVKNLLEHARKEYEVIIIDSGPILGSVEAAAFAPEVDGVIITVARGQQPALVEKTAQHLQSIGASVAGYVFNRAQPKDFYRSSYASSIRPMSSREMMVRVLSAESDGLLRFGPLVESVMSSLPANDLDDDDSLQAPYAPEAAMR